MELYIAPNGVVSAIYAEDIDLLSLGIATIKRASHVEPDEQGRWFARMIDGPTLGPYARRSEAIAAEIAWLTHHRLNSPNGLSEPISPPKFL